MQCMCMCCAVFVCWFACWILVLFVLQAPTTVQENMPSSSTTVQENMPSSQPDLKLRHNLPLKSLLTMSTHARRRQVNPAAPPPRQPPATQTQTIIRPGQGGMGVMFDENTGSYIYNVSLCLLFKYYKFYVCLLSTKSFKNMLYCVFAACPAI